MPPRRHLAALALLALLAAPAAQAFLLGSGSGAGAASVRNGGPVQVAPGATTLELSPGRSSDATVRITNPNPHRVHLPGLELDTSAPAAITIDLAHAGCANHALTFTPQDNDGDGWLIPAGQEVELRLHGAVAMAADADNACQGAHFALQLRSMQP